MAEFRTLADLTTGTVSAQGIDVSNFQGNYDWAHARASVPGLAFGIFRATQGLGGGGTNSPDPFARHNHDAIAAAGLSRGAYHFLNPSLDGARQANHFVTEMDGLGLLRADMLWLDNEDAHGLAPAAVSRCARAFMAELDKLCPHNPRGVYTFISFGADGFNAGLDHYPLWLARPGLTAPAPPPPWHRWTFWQWGIRNGVDVDAFNGSTAQLHAWIASFAPKPPAPAGPFRHTIPYQGKRTLTDIAKLRGTTVQHLAEVTAGQLAHMDLALLGALELPDGFVFFTSSP